MEATSDRVRWAELPPAVVERVGEVLGGPVTAAADQASGYSPGVAARVGTASGRRAFVKAAPGGLGMSAELYRREAAVLALLPQSVPAPRLLGTVTARAEGDDWFALITEEVDGRHPAAPPATADLIAILDVVAAAPRTEGLPLPPLADGIGVDPWPVLLAEHADALRPEARTHGPELDRLTREVPAHLHGERLVHLDTRSDNVLLDASGRPWLLDWAWASVGANWIDGFTALLDARLNGSSDTDDLLGHPLFDRVDPRGIDALLAALAGGFRLNALQPAPPRMPALRPFQAAQADVALDWLIARGALG
jgi:hypothetical protein